MKNIALFVKDFQKGTELSASLTARDMKVTFAESIYDLPNNCQIGIIDLDDTKYGNYQFISKLNDQAQLILIGYMDKVQQEIQEQMKMAGCRIVIPKASIMKNVQSLIEGLSK